MGGSLALAAQRYPGVEEVRGYDSDLGALATALGEAELFNYQNVLGNKLPSLWVPKAAFAQMADLRERMQQDLGQSLRLSLGMSGDLEAALAAGSDQLRIGTAFFGERSY